MRSDFYERRTARLERLRELVIKRERDSDAREKAIDTVSKLREAITKAEGKECFFDTTAVTGQRKRLKFINPTPEEVRERFEVLEDRGNSLLVVETEVTKQMEFRPTFQYPKDQLTWTTD